MPAQKIIVSELNFSEIKENIKAFIANNSQFTDYNFEGSGLSFLLDILAYNTYYNAFYLNMAINENFLDTAVKRSSVVSIAKNLGYLPRSKKSARALVSFYINEPNHALANGNIITLEKTNRFLAEGNNKTFTFSPIEPISVVSENGKYFFNNVELIEGVEITQTIPVLNPKTDKYIIPNFNIDTDTIEVYENITGTSNEFVPYELVKDIKMLTPESRVFYLFETTFKTYEIVFGDGVLGRQPTPGNNILIKYKTSLGEEGNEIEKFTLSGQIDGRFSHQDLVFTDITKSFGGSPEEDIESIRYNTLASFKTQDRAVTVEDYKFFLERDYPLIDSFIVWGGQDNKPFPQYGKVFISFKPKDGFVLTNKQKQKILNDIIKKKNVISIIPEIVDPDYLFLMVTTTVKYSSKLTPLFSAEIVNLILDRIQEYSKTYLTKFNQTFNYSKFITYLNESNLAIIGNLTKIRLRKNIPVILNKAINYNVNFQNKIQPGSIQTLYPFKSSSDETLNFTTLDLYIDDDFQGNLRIYRIGPQGEKFVLKEKIGTVNYETGFVQLYNLNFSSTTNTDSTIDLICEPKELDINSEQNTIITIVDTDIKILAKEQ